MCVSVHVFTQGEFSFSLRREDGCIFDRSSSSFVFCRRRQSRVLFPSFILPLSSIEQRLGERDHLSILFLSLISFILSPCFHLFSVEKDEEGCVIHSFLSLTFSLSIVMLSYSSPFSCAISPLYPQEKEKEYTFQSRWG